MEFLCNLYSLQYESIENKQYNFSIKLTSKNHPIFKAHFENNEILPGFIQVDIIQELMKQKIVSIKKAKFISIVKPEDIIEYKITTKDNRAFKAIVTNEKKNKVSEIVYEI